MENIAEEIVKRARMMPIHTGVELECNGVTITKVAVTGGFGVEVRSEDATLLFPMASAVPAARCFVTASTQAGEMKDRICPIIRHKNRIPLLTFEWNDKKERATAIQQVADFLKHPPLCNETQAAEEATTPLDVRGLVGWSVEM